jgi:hypothetical protein
MTRIRQLPRSCVTLLLAAVLLLTPPGRADAQILTDIYNLVQSTRNAVTTAINQAQAARSAAEEVRTQVRTGISYLTPELRAFLDRAVEEGRTILEEERAGLDTFAPGGLCATVCTAFRTNLLDFLTRSVELTEVVLASSGAPVSPDLSMVIRVAELAPPQVLYVMFRMFQAILASEFPSHVAGLIADAREVLPMLRAGVENPCPTLILQESRITRFAGGAAAVGAVTQALGGLFKVIGETEFSGEVGVAGFVSGNIKSNKRKQTGEFLGTVGQIVGQAANLATNKTRYCLLEDFQSRTTVTLAEMRTTIATLAFEVDNLDLPVSSRASQASVTEVHSTLQGVARDVRLLLDGDGGGTPGIPGSSLSIRILVERQLQVPELPLGIFYLPEPLGGLLDTVRVIVADNLTQHVAAGYSIGNAWQLVDAGDQARTAGDFRGAYRWYGQAYRLATLKHPDKKGG